MDVVRIPVKNGKKTQQHLVSSNPCVSEINSEGEKNSDASIHTTAFRTKSDSRLQQEAADRESERKSSVTLKSWGKIFRKKFRKKWIVPSLFLKDKSTKPDKLSPAKLVDIRKSNELKPDWPKSILKSDESTTTVPPSLAEVKDPSYVVGAKLCTESHHQFMEEMLKNYLQSARQRFDVERREQAAANAAGTVRQQQRRERISRSISVSSVVLKCMNGDCGKLASHSNNYLCDQCFETQKIMMESFSMAKAGSPARTLPKTGQTVKKIVENRTLPRSGSSHHGLMLTADKPVSNSDVASRLAEADRILEIPMRFADRKWEVCGLLLSLFN